MATMVPEIFPRDHFDGGTEAERKVFYLLKEKLHQSCICYYKPSINGGKQADFLVIFPDAGVAIIEVKAWSSSYFKIIDNSIETNSGSKESPFSQAKDYVTSFMNSFRPDSILHHQDGKLK